jgi:hypothetical protein
MKKTILLSVILFCLLFNGFSQSHVFKNIKVRCVNLTMFVETLDSLASKQVLTCDISVSKTNDGGYRLTLAFVDQPNSYAGWEVRYCTNPSFPSKKYSYRQTARLNIDGHPMDITEDGLVTPVKLSEVIEGKASRIDMWLKNENGVGFWFSFDCK